MRLYDTLLIKTAAFTKPNFKDYGKSVKTLGSGIKNLYKGITGLYRTLWKRHPIVTTIGSVATTGAIAHHIASKTDTAQQNPYQL